MYNENELKLSVLLMKSKEMEKCSFFQLEKNESYLWSDVRSWRWWWWYNKKWIIKEYWWWKWWWWFNSWWKKMKNKWINKKWRWLICWIHVWIYLHFHIFLFFILFSRMISLWEWYTSIIHSIHFLSTSILNWCDDSVIGKDN